jgi:Ca-activated chloride channel family protein
MHLSRTRRQTAIIVTLLGAGLGASGIAASNDVFRAGANVVLINATVLDRNHRPVRGLTRDNFRLFEEKVGQRISYFGEEEMPLSLAIVLDTSGSMEGKMKRAIRTLHTLLDHSGAGDEFALITFSDRAEVALPWTSDAVEIQNRAVQMRPRGNTALLDAVQLALSQLHRPRNPRRAVLILSDGGDNHSRSSERQITRLLEEVDVQVYAVDMSPETILRERSPEEVMGPDLLARICERAGGRYWQVEGERDLAATADQISREMRSQYVLGYAPSNSAADGLFRRVHLQLLPAGDKFSVYWRRGYRSPGK